MSCVGRTPPPSNSGPSPYHFFVTRRSVRLCRDALPLSFFCFFFLGVLGLFSNGNQVSQNIATRKHYPASQILLHDAECKCTVLLEDLNIWLKKHGQVPVDVHMCNVTPVSCIYDVYIYICIYTHKYVCVYIYILLYIRNLPHVFALWPRAVHPEQCAYLAAALTELIAVTNIRRSCRGLA